MGHPRCNAKKSKSKLPESLCWEQVEWFTVRKLSWNFFSRTFLNTHKIATILYKIGPNDILHVICEILRSLHKLFKYVNNIDSMNLNELTIWGLFQILPAGAVLEVL